jgi:hypothetical protein
MRNLTFTGFLKEYLRSISGTSTTSLQRLVVAAEEEERRLVEPLYLYAAMSGATERLLRLSKGAGFFEQYAQLVSLYKTKAELLKALEARDRKIPERYQKVYGTYRYYRDRVKSNREYSSRARQEILRAMSERGLSKYRIYKDLQLNPGNINNYLKNGDVRSVSRATVDRILDYARGASML